MEKRERKGRNRKDMDILDKITQARPTFSKGQKRIADFITSHTDKAAFMTASKLGATVGVSESTVVRFATELGYGGYPHLQKALQEMIRNKLTAVQRMEVTNDRMGNRDVLRAVLNSDIEKIRLTLDELDQETFNTVVEEILNAKHIYILGVRSSYALSSFIGFYFNLMFDNVRLVHTTSASEAFEQILRVGEGDVVLGISFPRYSRRTLQALEYARDSGATVIALTDSRLSPLSQTAHYTLIAKSDMASFVDSLVAPLSVINALIVALGMRKQQEVSDIFNKLETIWDEYQVYEKLDNE